MSIKDDVKNTANFVRTGYDKAESEVDGFFVRNKWTVVILSGVAVGIVVLAVLAIL